MAKPSAAEGSAAMRHTTRAQVKGRRGLQKAAAKGSRQGYRETLTSDSTLGQPPLSRDAQLSDSSHTVLKQALLELGVCPCLSHHAGPQTPAAV